MMQIPSAYHFRFFLFGYLLMVWMPIEGSLAKDNSVAQGSVPTTWNQWLWESSHWPATVVLFIAILYIIIEIIKVSHPREMVIHFQDLRVDADSSDQTQKAIKDQAITELFAAELRRVFSIHELAIDYCQQYFRDQDVVNSHTCADMTNIWSQIDIRAITIQDPKQIALTSNIFRDDLGEIRTETGPITTNIPISAVSNFFRSRRKDNIFISGSVQDKRNSFVVVAQILQGVHSWAWIVHPDDNLKTARLKMLPELIEDLACHVANRIMGQQSQLIDVLPGDHFRLYTRLLSDFVDYLQVATDSQHSSGIIRDTPEEKCKEYDKLKQDLDEFIRKEPFDLRTYYLTYVMSLLAIRKNKRVDALQYLSHAAKIEPLVMTAIKKTGLRRRTLHWLKEVSLDLVFQFKHKRQTSKLDRIRAERLQNILPNVNSTLGFIIEQSCPLIKRERTLSGRAYKKPQEEVQQSLQREPNINIDQDKADNIIDELDLEDAERALFLSNRAEILMKLADQQQPKDMLLELRLYYRLQSQELLKKACTKTSHQNIKYAYLRSGHFALSRGDLEEAIDYYDKAWVSDPSFVVAARNLASIYSMSGEYDKAIAVCDEALGIIGHNGKHLYIPKVMHAWIHNSKGYAYLLKAKQRRKGLDKAISNRLNYHSEYQPEWKDRECESWLKASRIELLESQRLLQSLNVQTIPTFNLFLNALESELLGTLSLDDLKEITTEAEPLTHEQDVIRQIYTQIFQTPEKFKESFEAHWKQHDLVPLEYFGFLGDLLLVQDYFEEKPLAINRNQHQLLLELLMKITDTPQNLQCMEKEDLKSRISKDMEIIEDLLPTCFVGLFYLWREEKERAVACWRRRLKTLEQYSLHTYDFGTQTAVALNHALWAYLYLGFICIFDTKQSDGEAYLHDTTRLSAALHRFERVFNALLNYKRLATQWRKILERRRLKIMPSTCLKKLVICLKLCSIVVQVLL
jgi:tetratricopeptide (TPR) repeat protein